MKTMPLTAIRSFSAMVERVDRLFCHESRSCHTGHRSAPGGLERPCGDVSICPCTIHPGRAPYAFPYPAVRVFFSTVSRTARDGGDDGVDGRGRTRAHPGPHRGADPARRPLVALPAGHVRGLHRRSSSTRRSGRSRAAHYYAEPYLSPFYSPCLGDCVEGASDFGQPFDWWPLSAALIILIFPLGFRMTCYYYRKAYYRAFWLSPPACAVAEPHTSYSGETRLPADPEQPAPLVLVRRGGGRG